MTQKRAESEYHPSGGSGILNPSGARSSGRIDHARSDNDAESIIGIGSLLQCDNTFRRFGEIAFRRKLAEMTNVIEARSQGSELLKVVAVATSDPRIKTVFAVGLLNVELNEDLRICAGDSLQLNKTVCLMRSAAGECSDRKYGILSRRLR